MLRKEDVSLGWVDDLLCALLESVFKLCRLVGHHLDSIA